MAVVNLLSTPVTNADAGTFNDPGVQNGRLSQSVAYVATGVADATSTFRMMRIPSNASGITLILTADDLGTTGTLNVGVYDTTGNGGAVVDATLFASAVDVVTAATPPTHIEHESGTYGIADVEKPLWEVLGLSADPYTEYDVTMVAAANIDVGGNVSLKLMYTQ